LLLVAPTEELDWLLGVRRGDVQRLDVIPGQFRLSSRGNLASPAFARLQRQHDVFAHRQVREDGLRLPVFGTKTESLRDRRPGRTQSDRLAVDVHLAGVGAVDAEEQTRRLRTPGAEQTGEPDDFAGAYFQIERQHRAASRQPL